MNLPGQEQAPGAATGPDECPVCGYALKGLPVPHRCPECGADYDENSRIWHARWIRAFHVLMLVGAPVNVCVLLNNVLSGRPLWAVALGVLCILLNVLAAAFAIWRWKTALVYAITPYGVVVRYARAAITPWAAVAHVMRWTCFVRFKKGRRSVLAFDSSREAEEFCRALRQREWRMHLASVRRASEEVRP